MLHCIILKQIILHEEEGSEDMTNNKTPYKKLGQLSIAQTLYDFVEQELIPETEVGIEKFWSSLEHIIDQIEPRNSELLAFRDELQTNIDQWHKNNPNHDHEAYKSYLQEIGYLVEPPADFQIDTNNLDKEIAEVAGPQLVVPLDNARYVLNAANARWGSLYDAFYSTDTITEANGCRKIKKYNPIRGERVIERTRHFLDRHFALERDTHKHVVLYFVKNQQLHVEFGDGTGTTLLKPDQFIGYTGAAEKPDSVLLKHHGLHVEIKFGEGYFIGRRDHANVYDVQIESALTTIMDCEDSVASVDTEDKLKVYRNWLGLMKGTLVETVTKEDDTFERKLEPDREYTDPYGKPISCHGRSLMLVRNVGMHLNTDAVLLNDEPIPETLLDCMVTALAAKHQILGNTKHKNSRAGSVYIVKPKMHGPDEVALANELFAMVEDALDMDRYTLKMGIMDEERRTSLNLKACIHSAKQRVVFINTGFLDRTGDDIHTSMEAGPMVPKEEIKHAEWLSAYEASNVQVGLDCGLMGKAQIGKGMYAMPDLLNNMMKTKISHLKAGANTSWVPSPIAATLHAIHYHRLNVQSRQYALMQTLHENYIDGILTIPLMDPDRKLTENEIRHEIENNAQGILGYVSRWVGQGIGCSKVPDINDIALMEDCATLRISSQHIANWLHHGIATKDDVETAMKRMAVIVDRQNRNDPNYQAMSDKFENSIPFQAAMDLVFKGRQQANGYTEFILYERRKEMKAV